ncbi:MAG: thiol reductase thioredoxin [Deltaproteobacteria bacterium]|nr:thiol reductase thioredoxin [Deltaproteobacteria bacterium]
MLTPRRPPWPRPDGPPRNRAALRRGGGASRPPVGRSRAATGRIHHATDATFAALVADAPAVLVDLWAPWCPPCLALQPIIKKVAATLGRRVKVVKVNVDENPELTRKFRVTAIPKLVLIHGARRRAQVGLLGEAALREWVRAGLATN